MFMFAWKQFLNKEVYGGQKHKINDFSNQTAALHIFHSGVSFINVADFWSLFLNVCTDLISGQHAACSQECDHGHWMHLQYIYI